MEEPGYKDNASIGISLRQSISAYKKELTELVLKFKKDNLFIINKLLEKEKAIQRIISKIKIHQNNIIGKLPELETQKLYYVNIIKDKLNNNSTLLLKIGERIKDLEVENNLTNRFLQNWIFKMPPIPRIYGSCLLWENFGNNYTSPITEPAINLSNQDLPC